MSKTDAAATTEKKERAKIVPVVYPALPAKTAEINNAYIKCFCKDKLKKGEITKEDVKEMENALYKAKEESESGRYFPAFRKAFVKKFFPLLDTAKSPSNGGESMEDFFGNLLSQE